MLASHTSRSKIFSSQCLRSETFSDMSLQPDFKSFCLLQILQNASQTLIASPPVRRILSCYKRKLPANSLLRRLQDDKRIPVLSCSDSRNYFFSREKNLESSLLLWTPQAQPNMAAVVSILHIFFSVFGDTLLTISLACEIVGNKSKFIPSIIEYRHLSPDMLHA